MSILVMPVTFIIIFIGHEQDDENQHFSYSSSKEIFQKWTVGVEQKQILEIKDKRKDPDSFAKY